jgi:hypothetical protein
VTERAPPSPEALATFRTEAAALDVEDVLALCFAFNKDPRRLRIYLDVLRSRSGIKAQAAACLICFDLARQGDTQFETEFMALLPVVAEWSAPTGEGGSVLADRLVGHNPYLKDLWADLQARLRAGDPRAPEAAELNVSDAELLEVQLLEDDDFADMDLDVVLEVDESALRAQWTGALDRFCIFNLTPNPLPADAPDGFHATTRADLDRLEALQKEASSLSDLPGPRGMLPIIELFLGTHTRARTMLGTRNRKRDAHVLNGLTALLALPEPPSEAVAWLQYPSAAPFAWEKVAELVLDYLGYFLTLPPDAQREGLGAHVKAYIHSGRPQPPPPFLSPDPKERRRR